MSNRTIELNDKDFELDFLAGESGIARRKKSAMPPYKVVIADDDDEMHQATKLLLKNFEFEDRGLLFIDTYTGDETIRVLNEEKDIAVIILDVVMESKVAGLEVVDYIRKVQENHKIRIILRTGQPGEAPENKVIADYDINDYRLKSELTAQRLFTSMYEALRSYRDIMILEHSRESLSRMIKMSSNLFSQKSIEDLYTCILDQLLCSKDTQPSALYFREMCDDCGFVFLDDATYGTIIAATGRYSQLLGKNIKEISELKEIQTKAKSMLSRQEDIFAHMENGYLISKTSHTGMTSFIYIESRDFNFDIELIKDYLTNYSTALDNYLINQALIENQKELIMLMSASIDRCCTDIGQQVLRTCKMGELIAHEIGLNVDVKKIIRIASRLHDIGERSELAFPLEAVDEHSIDLEEFTLIRKAAIIAGHQNKNREIEGYPLGITKEVLVNIAEITYLTNAYALFKSRNKENDLLLETYKEKANGLFNPIVWDAFINLKEKIENIWRTYPD